jgi:uncharacterized damage-inducible protein DinB
MTAAEVRTHIRYSGWASHRVLDAALALAPEEQTKPRGVSHESIAGTLIHIYFADRIWCKRTVEPELEMPPWNVSFPLDTLPELWKDVQRRWESWADSAADADLDRVVQFKLLNGNPSEARASHIVLHLVNHATLHRGQVVGLLRQSGVKPPVTDLIVYLRELQSATSNT